MISYNLKGMFWLCDINDEEKTVDVKNEPLAAHFITIPAASGLHDVLTKDDFDAGIITFDNSDIIIVDNSKIITPDSSEINRSNYENQIISNCLPLFNEKFSEYMKENDIYRFFPARSLTYQIDENIQEISICYYQNKKIYDIVFSKLFTDGLIMAPNEAIQQKLNKFYKTYSLDYYDDIIYNNPTSRTRLADKF